MVFGTLVLASLPSAPQVASPGCRVLGSGNVNFGGSSPTGDNMFWLTDDKTLWTALAATAATRARPG